ncbi:hypothetical protein HMSSN139_15900 [Paenibacillus sp. HMSSN-139]|nr:hypothetical protein HMSSN139_15900 [Paenibacillus sp. HMSSN-139]
MVNKETYEQTLAHVRTSSSPSELRITDIRFTDIIGGPFHSSLIKVYTNQGLVGFGEVRDGADKVYALMLKSRLLGENPCNIDKLFRRIKQFGGHARQGGGVSGIELALWDLAGKAYGVPIYQMLGGKFRDRIRMYCDTDVDGKDTGKAMGEALKKRMEAGFTFLKMDLGIGQIIDEPGTLSAPLGFLEEMREISKRRYARDAATSPSRSFAKSRTATTISTTFRTLLPAFTSRKKDSTCWSSTLRTSGRSSAARCRSPSTTSAISDSRIASSWADASTSSTSPGWRI